MLVSFLLRLVLFPPEAEPFLGYQGWQQHRYVFCQNSSTFSGHTSKGTIVENHASFDVFSQERDKPPEGMPLERARVATLHPGEALFLPALWSHAVLSEAGSSEEGEDAIGLNLAVNMWFVHRCLSHREALERRPGWSQGYFVWGNDLRSAGRHGMRLCACARMCAECVRTYFVLARTLVCSRVRAHKRRAEGGLCWQARHFSLY